MHICIFGDAQSVHIQQLAPALVQQGASVHVVTHKPAAVAGATVERFSVPPPGLTNIRPWRARHRAYLRGFLRRYDVINIQFLADWGFGVESDSGLPPDELSRGCLVASPWGSDIVNPPGEDPPGSELSKRRSRLLRVAAGVTGLGPNFAEVVAEFAGLNAADISLAPLGVDVDLFRPNGGPPRVPSPVVGYFKGFRPVYGPVHFIRAIPAILARIPYARFELIGDGPALADCHALAGELGVCASISWIHRRPHQQLPRFLSRWAVSVIPSVHESFCVAALEVSAMQLPVVASDVCGLRDTVRNHKTGLLVPPGDPDAMADAVVGLLQDPHWSQRLGAEGRRFVEQAYDWDDVAVRWMDAFHRARDRCCVMV